MTGEGEGQALKQTAEADVFDEIAQRNKEKERLFGEGNILKLIVKFSLPAIVGMLVNAVYNIVDTVFIGHALGEVGAAALNFAFPVNMIVLGMLLMFGAGGAALYSIRMGQKRYNDASKVMGNALSGILIVIAVFVPIGIVLLKDVLLLFRTTESALPYAYEYLFVTCLGLPFFAVSLWGNNFMRATGRPMLSMFALLIGGVVNLILDPVFIFGFNMGIQGAAIATVIGQAASATWMLVHFLSPRAKIRLTLKMMLPNPKLILNVLKYGIPFFVFQSAMSIVQFVINYSIVTHSSGSVTDSAIAAMGAVQKFQTIIYMPITGLAQGITPIMAYNYGAGKIHRSNRVLLYSMIGASFFGLFGFVIAQSMPRIVLAAFISNASADYYDIGIAIMRTWTLGYPIYCYILASNFYTATGKPVYSAFLAIMRQVLVFVPAIIILPILGGFKTMFYANIFADGIAAIVVAASLSVSIFVKQKKVLLEKSINTVPENAETTGVDIAPVDADVLTQA